MQETVKTLKDIYHKNTDFNNPDSAINLAESLNTISSDIYTENLRFVFELLQNADDAANDQQPVDVAIEFTENFIILSHNGRPFNARDLKGLCNVGYGTKSRAANKTGYKGIGFKSVFGKSDYVCIKTEKVCFRFDKNATPQWNPEWGDQSVWEKENDRKFKSPWQIIPLITKEEALPTELRDSKLFHQYPVSTAIKLQSGDDFKKELGTILKDLQILLFLRSIQKISLVSEKLVSISKENIKDKVVLKINGEVYSVWLVKKCILTPSESIKAKIDADNRVPQKLKNTIQSELILAVTANEGKIVPVQNSIIYNYLPTKITDFGFPFLVNGNFLTNASREALHADMVWNQWLFQKLPECLLNWLSEIAQSAYARDILKLLPELSDIRDRSELARKFKTGFKDALEKITFIPTESGELHKIDQCLFDRTGIFAQRIFDNGRLIDTINQQYQKQFSLKSLALSLKKINKIEKYGAYLFTNKILIELLRTKQLSEALSVPDNIKLIRYFYDLNSNPKINEEALNHTPFIFDKNQQLCAPLNLFFPDNRMTDTETYDFHFIHPDVMTACNKVSDILEWLQILGVQKPSNLIYILSKIFPNVTEFITPENAVETLQILFEAFRNNQLQPEHLQKLKKLKLLTTDGKLIAAKDCYLSAACQPALPLEGVLDEIHFVSPDYVTKNDDPLEWKLFLRKIGVAEKIDVLKAQRTRYYLLSGFDNGYFSEDRRKVPHYQNYCYSEYSNLVRLRYMEYANQFEFSVEFWEYVINNVNLNDLTVNAKGYWGIAGMGGQTSGDNIENYIPWYIRSQEIIPTTDGKCHKTTDVFLNTPEVTKIVGKYLPLFKFEGELSPDWKALFQFKTKLHLSDFLELLTAITNDRTPEGEIKKENIRRLDLIYEKLVDLVDNLSSAEIEQIKSWGNENVLLSTDNTFYPPAQLTITELETLKLNVNHLYIPDKLAKLPSFKKLACMFGVSLFDNNSLQVNYDELEDDQKLKEKLFQFLPYFALSIDPQEGENLMDQFNDTVSNLQMNKVRNLSLTIDGTVIDKPKIFYQNNCIYHTRDWDNPFVMHSLPDILSELFDCSGKEDEIRLLLQLDQSDAKYWLMEKGVSQELIEQLEQQIPNFDGSESTGIDWNPFIIAPAPQEVESVRERNKKFFSPDDEPNFAIKLLNIISQLNSPFAGYIYHYAHIETAAKIIDNQKILSREKAIQLLGEKFKNSAGQSLIGKTRDFVKQCARFYLRPKTPTQWHNEGLGANRLDDNPMCPVPIFFQLPLQNVLQKYPEKVFISNGNLSSNWPEYGNSYDFLKNVDFAFLYKELEEIDLWSYKRASQQELIVKDELDFSDKPLNIICCSENDKSTLIELIGKQNPYADKIKIDSSFYFKQNPQVVVNQGNNSVKISINRNASGKLRLSFYSKTAKHSAEPPLRLLTKKEIEFQTDYKLYYAVDYLSGNGEWLIYKGNYKTKKVDRKSTIRNNLNQLLLANDLNKGELINCLKQIPEIAPHFVMNSSTNGYYTMEKHILLVLSEFEKYYASVFFNTTDDRKLMRILICLHDVGKPKALQDGQKENEHLFTIEYIFRIRDYLPLTNSQFNILIALIEKDPIGFFLQGKINLATAIEQIFQIFIDSNVSKSEYSWLFKLLTIFYQVDAGSYTKDAGGIPYLEKLFKYADTENKLFDENKKRLIFAEEYEPNFQRLELFVSEKVSEMINIIS